MWARTGLISQKTHHSFAVEVKKIVLLAFVLLLLSAAVVLIFVGLEKKEPKIIYVRADGSIHPDTAAISTVDNIKYTLKDNISNQSIILERDNIVVDGAYYAVQGDGSGTGMNLTGRNNVTITNMKIKDFKYGISLYESSNNIIFGNRITNNMDGIRIAGYSNNNTISQNTLEKNSWSSINLQNSLNNLFYENNITNNNYGISLHESSSNNSIYENTIDANNGVSIHLSHSSNNIISENTIINNEDKLYLDWASNNTIVGNNITNNRDGISLSNSSNNIVSGNNITANNWIGIDFHWSSNNIISGNIVTANSFYGISIRYSSNNFLYGNLLVRNWYGFGVWGNELNHYLHSADTSNLVDDKPIYYLISQEGSTINPITHSKVGFLALIDSSNITVEGLTLTKNIHGLLIAYTNNTKIQNNNLTNNNCGIYLNRASGNTIVGNNITNNERAIALDESSNNHIYHNNFISNTQQAYTSNPTNVWDDGYPSGGNYWSDYEERYPKATEIDGSGIWDIPYVIDGNQDNYPMVRSFQHEYL